jgi:Integrase zinc binding domain
MNNTHWIPERAVELQLRLCAEAHCRSAGHRAYEPILGAIKEYVVWTTMAKNVKVFVQELFALCRYYSWRQSATPVGYAAICNQAQRDPEF